MIAGAPDGLDVPGEEVPSFYEISGLSARFVALNRDVQTEIIHRHVVGI